MARSWGVFHDSDGASGIDFPEQINVTPTGTIMVGGFSDPEGIYEYDASGTEINYWGLSAATRAAYPLANGTILFTGLSGMGVFDPATGAETIVTGDSTRFITPAGGTLGTNYCISLDTSLGSPATISATGSLSVADNNFFLSAEPVPNQPGIFFYGPTQTINPFGNGFLCITGTIGRLSVENAAGNVISHALDNTQPPNPATVITSGSTWNFQCWFRDPAAGGAAFNLSDALEATFSP